MEIFDLILKVSNLLGMMYGLRDEREPPLHREGRSGWPWSGMKQREDLIELETEEWLSFLKGCVYSYN